MTAAARPQSTSAPMVAPARIADGYSVDLIAPDFTDVPWSAIAASLCAIPRFNGAFGTLFQRFGKDHLNPHPRTFLRRLESALLEAAR